MLPRGRRDYLSALIRKRWKLVNILGRNDFNLQEQHTNAHLCPLRGTKEPVGLGVETCALRALQGSRHTDTWEPTPHGCGHGKGVRHREAGEVQGPRKEGGLSGASQPAALLPQILALGFREGKPRKANDHTSSCPTCPPGLRITGCSRLVPSLLSEIWHLAGLSSSCWGPPCPDAGRAAPPALTSAEEQ